MLDAWPVRIHDERSIEKIRLLLSTIAYNRVEILAHYYSYQILRMGDTKEPKKSQSSADASKKPEPKTLMEAMEEDDKFEEFEPEHWGKDETEEETQQWMDNWDDDMDDDFTKNLREELGRASEKK